MSQIDALTRVQRRALMRASRDRLAFAENLRPILTLRGKEYGREDLSACSYSGDDSGMAMLLDVAAKDRLPRDVEQSRVSLAFETETPEGVVRLPAFAGYALRRRSRGYAVQAATGGYETERTPIGRGPAGNIEWNGVRPDAALFEALQPLRRRYASYDIGPFPEPRLYRRGPDKWTWEKYAKELCDYAAEQAEVVLADTPTNVAFAYPLEPVGRDADPVWHFEAGVDCDEVGDETPDGERYASAIVHSQPDDDGGVDNLAEYEVDDRGVGVFGGSAYLHALDPEVDDESASVIGNRLARRLGRNDTRVTVECKYPPFFLRRGDVCSATDKEFEIVPGPRGRPRGTLTLFHYLFRVQSISPVDALAMSGSVSGEGMLVGTETREMSLPEFDRNGGFTPLWGTFPDGQPFLDTRLPYVVFEGGEWFVDTEIAERHGVFVVEQGGQYVITDGSES